MMKALIERFFHLYVEKIYRHLPRRTPSPHSLLSCRIVSHRGEHDNQDRMENTLEAFDAAAAAGVWGLELDVRWTQDLIPVVFHDTNTRRLYKKEAVISQMKLDRVRIAFPSIPTLAEVIDRYGCRQHLMIEIKTEPYPDPVSQSCRMKRLLSHLTPGENFHLMCLHPEFFDYFSFLPAKAFIPIARLRIDRFSRLAAMHRWGGVACHFLMATPGVLARHHEIGQGIGTGFADSRNCLFREVNRGVDWNFSNRAVEMQRLCRKVL